MSEEDGLSLKINETYGDELECPYCGCVEEEADAYDEGSSEFQCGNCSEVSHLVVYRSSTYTAQTQRHHWRDEAEMARRVRDWLFEPGSKDWLSWDAKLRGHLAKLKEIEGAAHKTDEDETQQGESE